MVKPRGHSKGDQMNFFKAKDGTQIFFKDAGSGAPVILIHGWPLNDDMFEDQTYRLLEE